MKKITLSFLAAFFTVTAFAETKSNPFQISEELDKSIKAGLHELYNLNFDKAEQIFKSIESEAPKHPMVAFGKASVHWWRLSVYVIEPDEKESKPFLDAVEECVQYSKKIIEEGDKTGEAHLTLGGVYGLLGRWQATNQKWMTAYFTGKKAVKFLRKSISINPEMIDANMGLGIFDYYVATLPAMVRMLGFLGSGSDPAVGITELETAAYSGTYSQTPSKLFLAEIYSNFEKKPEPALKILAELREEYPTSPFIHMMYVIVYYNHYDPEGLKREADEYLSRVNNGTYSAEYKVQAYFSKGLVFLKQREWKLAAEQFSEGIATGSISNPWYTWSYLYRGNALDALGDREAAKKDYKAVLSQIRRWGSHDNAKKYLSQPFKGTDDQLKKLVL